MKLIIGLWFAGLSAIGGESTVFPQELDHLNKLPQDEQALVEGVRNYARLLVALAEWDEDIAQELAMNGELDQARERLALSKQRIELAGKAYLILVRRFPKNARALNYYGEHLYDHEGDIAGAIRYWKQAVAEDPKLALPYNNLGIHYTHVGELELGLKNYQKAIELDSENPDFKFNLAQTYLINSPQVAKIMKWKEAKVFKEGMKLSKAAAQLKPNDFELQQDYATNFYAAERFDVEPDWKEAALAWQRARAAAKDNGQLFFTWLNEARVHIRNHEGEKAERCLHEALKIDPNNAVAKKLLEDVKAGQIGVLQD